MPERWAVHTCHSGSPLHGQRELSITAQQPQGTAGIIAISFPATLGSAGTQTGFPSSLALAQDDTQMEWAIKMDQSVYK